MSLKLVLEIVIRFDAADVFCMVPLAVVVAAAALEDKLAFAMADAILFDVVTDDAEVVNWGGSNL